MKLGSCHFYGQYNLEVAPIFLDNLYIPIYTYLHHGLVVCPSRILEKMGLNQAGTNKK